MEPISIRIPWAIDLRLGLNGRVHWRTKKRLKDEVQGTALRSMQAARLPRNLDDLLMSPLILDFEIGLKRNAKTMDDDNAIGCLKSVRDAIAAYVGIDDKFITTGTVTQVRDPEGRGYVDVTLRSLEGGAA